MELCKDLIPTNGVHVTENFYPRGFYVAKYDAEGLTEGNRYFTTREAAEAYAHCLIHGDLGGGNYCPRC